MSTGVEAELLRQDKPSWVTAEVTPQHLLLNSSAYEQLGTLAQMNPPLRTPQDLNSYRPVRRCELLTKCGWSPFEGWNLTGWPVVTIVGGQIAYNRGNLHREVRGQALTFGEW